MLIVKPLFTMIAFLLLSLNLYAFNVEITPKEAIPGDVFSLRVKDHGPSPVEAEFIDKRIDLFPAGDDLIALVPLSLDTAPRKYDITVKHGGEERTASIEVRHHKFKTIELALPEEQVILSPEDLERVQKEAGLLEGICSRSTSMAWEKRFVSPTGTEVSTEFGLNRIMNGKRNSIHKGTDFRGQAGTPVRSINSGTVVLTGDLFFGGNTLVVDHGMGLYSIYMHLSKFNVSEGDKISKEDIVGFVGSSGRATGPHLHLSVKLNGVSVNPESLFRLEL